MNIEYILFILRLISALLLLGILSTLFYIIWKTYNLTIKQIQSTRRIYGRLVVLQEIDGTLMATGETHPLYPVTSLGRAPTNTITIKDSFASNEHAQISLKHGQWWLEDKHSRNGTILNDLLITQPVIITNSDLITIGKKHYRFDLYDG